MTRRTILSCVAAGAIALLMAGRPALAAPVDISGYFNWDTIINDQSETLLASDGYRPESNNEYFATEAGSFSITGGDGIDGDGSDIPNNGQIAWGVHDFQMGPLTGTDFNTVMMDNDELNSHPDLVTIGIAAGSYAQLAVLHNSVALGTHDNGTVTVNYTAGDPDVVEWDNADWAAGLTAFGMSLPVLGDLGYDPSVADGMDFYRYQKSSVVVDSIISTTEGRLYAQAFAVDHLRTVASLTFTLPESTEGDIGIYALSGSSEPLPSLDDGVPIAISGSYFNQDTIINDPGDDTSQGYRPGIKSEYFATEAGSLSVTGGDGTDGDGTDIPNSGTLQAGVFPFEFGPLTEDALNTIVMDNDEDEMVHPSSVEIDIANGSYEAVSVLYTGVAVDPDLEGTMTVVYSDSSETVYDWDLADWSNEDTINFAAQVALGRGLDFYRDTSGAIIDTEDGKLFCQCFYTDGSKIIDSLQFALNDDVEADTDIGIYALAGVEGDIVFSAPPGDADEDGDVDADDAAILAANWLMTGTAGWTDGDFNGDNNVDDKDATILAANWGCGLASASVPEPSVLFLITVGLAVVALARGNRRRRSQ